MGISDCGVSLLVQMARSRVSSISGTGRCNWDERANVLHGYNDNNDEDDDDDDVVVVVTLV